MLGIDTHPSIGLFISRDAGLRQAGDTNLHGYVRNNPVSYVDSTGLATKKVTGTGGPDGIYGLFATTWDAIKATATARGVTALHIPVISQDYHTQRVTESSHVILTKASYVAGTSFGQIVRQVNDCQNTKCVGVLEFLGHAQGAQGVTIGSGQKNPSSDDTANYIGIGNAEYQARQLRKRVCFCPRCLIVLGSCNMGNWTKSRVNVPQIFADNTACEVVSPGGFSGGFFANLTTPGGMLPGTRATYLDAATHKEETYYERHREYDQDAVHDSAEDTWYVTTRDSTSGTGAR